MSQSIGTRRRDPEEEEEGPFLPPPEAQVVGRERRKGCADGARPCDEDKERVGSFDDWVQGGLRGDELWKRIEHTVFLESF